MLTAHEQRHVENLRMLIGQIRQAAFSLANLDAVEGHRDQQIEQLQEVASDLEEELDELENQDDSLNG